MLPETSADHLETLARAALGGNHRAFAHFSVSVLPIVESAARRGARGRDAEDDFQELYTSLLERLQHDDFAGLRAFVDWHARHPEKDIVDWLRIVLANLARDRARKRVGRRREGSDLPSAKRVLNELWALVPLGDDVAYRPPITTDQTAREILAFAEEHLPLVQALALSTWIRGESFEDLRAKTGLETEADAVRLVRAAIATLRRRYSET